MEEVTERKAADIKLRRYCTSCQSEQPPEGGVRLPNRWMCAACVYRKKHRIANWKKNKQ